MCRVAFPVEDGPFSCWLAYVVTVYRIAFGVPYRTFFSGGTDSCSWGVSCRTRVRFDWSLWEERKRVRFRAPRPGIGCFPLCWKHQTMQPRWLYWSLKTTSYYIFSSSEVQVDESTDRGLTVGVALASGTTWMYFTAVIQSACLFAWPLPISKDYWYLRVVDPPVLCEKPMVSSMYCTYFS